MSIVLLSRLDLQPAILAVGVIKGKPQIVENGQDFALKLLESGMGF
jgi:hypothetical protein